MKKKLVSLLALGLVFSCLTGNAVNAAGLYDIPADVHVQSEQKDADAVIAEVFTESEMLEMLSVTEYEIAVVAATVTPDRYEPNDTMETAYRYANTVKMSGVEFTEGYTSANCHVEGDVDYFSVTLSPAYTYDVVLKNLYGQDRHIYIWENNGDNTWTRWRYRYQETGEPEYWRFTPETGGTYYIEISGGGVESFSFFFAVEKTGRINTDLWPTADNT